VRTPLTDSQLERTLERHGYAGAEVLGVHYHPSGGTLVIVRGLGGTARLRVPDDVLADTAEPTDLAPTTRTLFDRNYKERG
jgi:hypothetical protein